MRILVLLLVIGTLAGTFCYAIYFLFVGGMRVNGQENTEAPEDGYLVRVALEYGSSVAASYRTAAENGYIYGTENSDNVMTEMGTLPYPSLHVAYEQNLVKNADGNYEAPADGKTPLVGCYHINIETTQTAPFALIADRVRSFLGENTVIFRSVTVGKEAGKEVLSVGQYGTESEAKAAKAKLDELINAQYVVPEDTTSEDTSSPETTVPEETTADETTSPDGTSSSEETTSAESTSPEETTEPETTTAPETEPEEPEPKEPDEAEKLIISGVIPKPDQDAL
ncbi:MAG: hypothetical protein KBT31_06635, partial [Firmicutes bacterium]|nr:hypothetical protein [Candidatus Colimorpha enterica]